jgi:hypothetical protein
VAALQLNDQVFNWGQDRGHSCLLGPGWGKLTEVVDKLERVVDHLLVGRGMNENMLANQLKLIVISHEEMKEFN